MKCKHKNIKKAQITCYDIRYKNKKRGSTSDGYGRLVQSTRFAWEQSSDVISGKWSHFLCHLLSSHQLIFSHRWGSYFYAIQFWPWRKHENLIRRKGTEANVGPTTLNQISFPNLTGVCVKISPTIKMCFRWVKNIQSLKHATHSYGFLLLETNRTNDWLIYWKVVF